MAGVSEAGLEPPARALRTGLARAQYAALASMRWSMFRNTIRSTRGAMELGAQTVTFGMFGILGLGLASGLGMGAYTIASRGSWDLLPFLFWSVFAMWQLVPITIASFQQQFEMAGLLRFPVSFSAFFLLHLIFGLLDLSTLVGGLCCLGMWIGVTVARPELVVWTAAALAVFAAFNVLLVRTIFSWIERWLAQRRTREIAMAIFFVLVLGLQLLNPGLRQHPGTPEFSAETRTTAMRWAHTASAVQRWLPPGAAALTVQEGDAQEPLGALGMLGVLGMFAVATGATLAVRLHAEYRGENLGEAPSRGNAERERGGWSVGGGPIAAVFEKELRTLLRAIPLLYQVGAPVVVVFVLASVNRNRSMGSSHLPLGLLLCLAYAFVGFTQLMYNNLGGEGAGVQLLFLSPTPMRTVLLGKNLFHAALFAMDAVVVSIVACWRLGTPPVEVIAASAAWAVFALPVHLAAGNMFSLTMPYKINLGRLGRQKGSQANGLFSLLVQVVVLGVGAGVFVLCAYFGRLWLATPIFVTLAVVSAAGWLLMLRGLDRVANERRSELAAVLAKSE